MCEIFPEVSNFCGFLPLKIGMLIISILSVVSGALTLAMLQKHYDVGFGKMVTESIKLAGYFVIAIFVPKKFIFVLLNYIPHGISAMCFGFILCGFILLFATLTDQEGFVQVFVWVTFLNIFIGFLLLFGIGYQCLMYPACFMTGMDWLTSTVVYMAAVTYLFLWIYFISVANSYVLLE